MVDHDLEKADASVSGKYHSDSGSSEGTDGTQWTRFVDSFKRDPNARTAEVLVDAEGKPLPNQPAGKPALAMKLKDRHLQMIAIGGSIGMVNVALSKL